MVAAIHAFVRRIVDFASSLTALSLAVGFIVGWTVWAWPQHFSSDSQMPVNSVTTLVTFIMSFLILIATKHESRATQLKLSELVRSVDKARNEVADAEKKDDAALTELERCKDEVAQ